MANQMTRLDQIEQDNQACPGNNLDWAIRDLIRYVRAAEAYQSILGSREPDFVESSAKAWRDYQHARKRLGLE
jgi:hypothetical protein